jgi:putative ABC transport system permease protein
MRLFTEINEGIRISVAALLANKLRSTLTTVGIVIGILTVTLMGTAIDGLNRAFLQSISALGSDVLYVHRRPWFIQSHGEWMKMRMRREVTWQQYRALKDGMTLAQAVAPVTDARRPVKYKNRQSTGVIVVGTTDEFLITSGVIVTEGRFLTASESEGGRPVCVLGHQVATNLFIGESPIGKKIKVEDSTMEVIGVLDRQGTLLGEVSLDNRIVIPIRFLLTTFRWSPDYEIQVKALSVKTLEETKEEIRGIMRRARRLRPGDADDFSINQQDLLVNRFNRVAGTIAAVGLFITGLSLFVGGIGIMNIMFVSVAERTSEIGIRKAIGARRRTILVQFLIEAAGICLLGGIIGLSIAVGVTLFMQRYFPVQISIQIISIALCVSIATGLASGFFPAWRAARMNPVDALRNE